MKVLLDCMPLRAGGGVQVAIAIMDALRQQTEIEWRVAMPQVMFEVLPNEVLGAEEIHVLNKVSGYDILRSRFMLQNIEREFNPDVVFTVFGPAYFRAKAPHLVGFALPNLVYERDGILADSVGIGTHISDALRKHLLKQASHIVVETEAVRQRLALKIGYPLEKISVVQNSVNPQLLAFGAEPRKQIGPLNILVPSTWYLHKNLEIIPFVAHQISKLAPELNFNFQLTLDENDPNWRAIQSSAAQLNQSARVTSLGVLPLNRLAAAYNESACVFLPTLREVSTAVYPESFYFKRPLVTSDMDFAHELCGNSALFVTPREAEACAKGLISVLSTPALANDLVARGERQLKDAYPTTREKFEMQKRLLETLAKTR